MSAPANVASSSWFTCDYPDCKARYRRKEHLNRHLNHHNGGRTFACPHCESYLTRNDLLRRHIRTYHPQIQVPRPRKLKACSACHARKYRCEGGFPCNACQARGIICVRAGDEIVNEQQNFIDDLFASEDIPTVDESPPTASRWIAHDYVDIYFDYFHSAWPFLHRGTFDFAQEPCVLVQSVVAIGMWVEGSRKTRDASICLHGRLCSAFYAQMDQWCMSDSGTSQGPSPRTRWPMTTLQSVLLNIILALFIAREKSNMDLGMRFQLPDDKYQLLVSLVRSCRWWGLFSYPNMLRQHEANAPLALVWVNVEEIKRFGLALYKVCQLATCSNRTGEGVNSGRNELLTLADLSFCIPDSDELWNAPSGTESEKWRDLAYSAVERNNGDPQNWISQTSTLLHNAQVNFDWI